MGHFKGFIDLGADRDILNSGRKEQDFLGVDIGIDAFGHGASGSDERDVLSVGGRKQGGQISYKMVSAEAIFSLPQACSGLTMKPTDSSLTFRKDFSGIYLCYTLFQVQLKNCLGFPTAHILRMKKTQILLSLFQ